MAYLDLTRAVRGVDSLLRQRRRIQEFTDDDDCLFRISLEAASRSLTFPDGTSVREGDPVLNLHLWNEHLPSMPSTGPSAAWANAMKRGMRRSLAAVAHYLERERALDAVNAVHGAPPFGSRIGGLQMLRTAQRFGFEVMDLDTPLVWRDHLHAAFDSMWLWSLAHAFNPGALKSKGLLRYRFQLWISRRKLLLCYGAAAAASVATERDGRGRTQNNAGPGEAAALSAAS